MHFVMAAFGEGKSQGKLQLFQLVVLFGKEDAGSRSREGFHGVTFFSFCHHGLPSVAIQQNAGKHGDHMDSLSTCLDF